MNQPDHVDQLMALPCADIPEFQSFVQQVWRKQALMEQSGGGEAFLSAAAPVIRKNVLQSLAYLSPSRRYVNKLRHKGVSDETLDHALARAWLEDSDQFFVPRRQSRDILLGTSAILVYSILVGLAVAFELIAYLRHAHPAIAAALMRAPPLIGLCGVPVVLVVFIALRKILHR